MFAGKFWHRHQTIYTKRKSKYALFVSKLERIIFVYSAKISLLSCLMYSYFIHWQTFGF